MKTTATPVPVDPVNYSLESGDLSGDYVEFLQRISNVPDSPPLHPIAIAKAGITRQSVYLKLPLITGGETSRVPVYCEVEAAASLVTTRGVHMSRFEESLFEVASGDEYRSIDEFAALLARSIRNKQSSDESYVKAEAIMLLPRKTPVTGRTSYDRVTLIGEASCAADRERVNTTVEAFNVTACPCTRAFTKFSVVPALQEKGFALEQIKDILDTVLTGTHLQRGTVRLTLEKTSPSITSDSLFRILDSATHLVFDLLKRADEHALVIRALQRPQFTEDVVRDIAYATFREHADSVPPLTQIHVKSVLQDSIHIHDVFTEIQTTFEELAKELRGSRLA